MVYICNLCSKKNIKEPYYSINEHLLCKKCSFISGELDMGHPDIKNVGDIITVYGKKFKVIRITKTKNIVRELRIYNADL